MARTRTRAIEADLEGVPDAIAERVVIFRLLIAIGGRLRALMDRRYRTSGITTQQAALLAVVKAAPEPLTQGEAARQLGVSHQNVRQLADALAAKGLLEVRVDPRDRRIKQLIPTRRVAPLFARRNRADFEAVASWFSTLTDEEARELRAMLGRLLEGLSARTLTTSAAR